jgi:Protein of unknown function (DUF2975)
MKLPHPPSNDPLLFATSLLLCAVCGFLILAGMALAIAIPGVALGWPQLSAEILKSYPDAELAGLMPAILGCVALGIGLVAMAFRFVRNLLQIIRTVGEGDPFVPPNADRLQRMAWLTLAIQIVGLIIGSAVFWISKRLHEADLSIGFGLESWITILLLFVLARIFRRGTQMREELEGTV